MGAERRGRGRGPTIQQGGELEVDQAEAPVGIPVGDVAHHGIVVPHAERFQLREERLHALRVQVIHPRPAVGGDDLQLLRQDREQARHEVASPRLEVAQDPHLILETLARRGSPEGLVDPPVETDPHQGPGGVFDLVHGGFG